jgi:hypothetical protein
MGEMKKHLAVLGLGFVSYASAILYVRLFSETGNESIFVLLWYAGIFLTGLAIASMITNRIRRHGLIITVPAAVVSFVLVTGLMMFPLFPR